MIILNALIAGSALSYILADQRRHHFLRYIFKPLTMLLICLLAIQSSGISPFYKDLVIAGLIFSLFGDIFLMLPTDRFIAGLSSFLIAHLFYSAAFASKLEGISWWPLLPFLACGILLFSTLASFLGTMKWPVLIYSIVISVMAWLACEWMLQTGSNAALLAFSGAILFVISDAILALNRFRWPFRTAQIFIMSTYFAAQWFIASSIQG